MSRPTARQLAVAVAGAAWMAALSTGCGANTTRHDGISNPWSALAPDGRPDVDDRNGDDLVWMDGKMDLLYPHDRYFVGVGTCGQEVGASERMDCAIHRALGQAVSMVRQHVRVDVHRRTELERKTGTDGFEASVRSTYQHDGIGQAELTVDDAAPRRRSCTADGRCHALIALDRSALARRSLNRIAQMRVQVDDLLDRAEKADAVTAIEQLSAASRLVTRIDHEAELVAAAAGPNAAPRSAWQRFSAVRAKRLESLAVCLSSSRSDPPAQLVFARAHQDLSTRGFARVTIAREPDCPEDAISVTFDGSTLERVAEYELWVFEVRGTVVLRAGARTLGKGLPVLGRGVAHVREQARSEAEDDLAMNVQQSLARLLDPTEANAP